MNYFNPFGTREDRKYQDEDTDEYREWQSDYEKTINSRLETEYKREQDFDQDQLREYIDNVKKFYENILQKHLDDYIRSFEEEKYDGLIHIINKANVVFNVYKKFLERYKEYSQINFKEKFVGVVYRILTEKLDKKIDNFLNVKRRHRSTKALYKNIITDNNFLSRLKSNETEDSKMENEIRDFIGKIGDRRTGIFSVQYNNEQNNLLEFLAEYNEKIDQGNASIDEIPSTLNPNKPISDILGKVSKLLNVDKKTPLPSHEFYESLVSDYEKFKTGIEENKKDDYKDVFEYIDRIIAEYKNKNPAISSKVTQKRNPSPTIGGARQEPKPAIPLVKRDGNMQGQTPRRTRRQRSPTVGEARQARQEAEQVIPPRSEEARQEPAIPVVKRDGNIQGQTPRRTRRQRSPTVGEVRDTTGNPKTINPEDVLNFKNSIPWDNFFNQIKDDLSNDEKINKLNIFLARQLKKFLGDELDYYFVEAIIPILREWISGIEKLTDIITEKLATAETTRLWLRDITGVALNLTSEVKKDIKETIVLFCNKLKETYDPRVITDKYIFTIFYNLSQYMLQTKQKSSIKKDTLSHFIINSFEYIPKNYGSINGIGDMLRIKYYEKEIYLVQNNPEYGFVLDNTKYINNSRHVSELFYESCSRPPVYINYLIATDNNDITNMISTNRFIGNFTAYFPIYGYKHMLIDLIELRNAYYGIEEIFIHHVVDQRYYEKLLEDVKIILRNKEKIINIDITNLDEIKKENPFITALELEKIEKRNMMYETIHRKFEIYYMEKLEEYSSYEWVKNPDILSSITGNIIEVLRQIFHDMKNIYFSINIMKELYNISNEDYIPETPRNIVIYADIGVFEILKFILLDDGFIPGQVEQLPINELSFFHEKNI